jgi:hypothetical protein
LTAASLLKQQPPNRAQIVQNAVALLHVDGQLAHLVDRHSQRLLPPLIAFDPGGLNVVLYFLDSVLHGFHKESDKLVGALDGIKRSLGFWAHPALLIYRENLDPPKPQLLSMNPMLR